MGIRRKKSRRRCAASNRHYSLIGSSYARRLHVETLEDRRLLAVFTVSNSDDAGAGSLRDAIDMANAAAGADEIQFSVNGTIDLVSQLPTITDDLTITGPGADLLAIDAGSTTTPLMGDGFRIFEINDGTAGLIDVSIAGLTLTGADVPHVPASGSSAGGAILNAETLTLDRTSIVANRARFGGGIFQDSTASTTITNSTISGNVASQNGGGVTNSGAFTATNVTISNNSADGGGGIILSTNPSSPIATLDLSHSTLTGNTATNGTHGIWFFTTYGPSTATFNHTIVNNAVVGVGGATTLSGSFNLFGKADPGITGTNNQFSTDPLLGPLADNGGPTLTHALLLGSLALDAGDPAISGGVDQRGLDRVQLGRIDIGAFELQTTIPSQGLIVSTNNDGVDRNFAVGQLSLREAILIANDANAVGSADEITFAVSGTINIASQLPTITDDLTINGPGANSLTIDAGNGADNLFNTGDGFRILEIDNGDNGNLIDVEISGLTLIGGDVSGSFAGDPAGRGGAIRNLENLTLTASTLSGNATSGSSDFGGGIYNSLYAGTLDVTATTISGNTTSGSGGGIFNRSTALVTITSSTTSGNSAGSFGGGIHNAGGAVTLTSSTVSGNTVSGNGGGISSYFSAVTLTSSTVSENTSGGSGGGIFTESSAVTLTSSTVSGNTSSSNGGGIRSNDGAVTLTSSTISGNTSNDDGGGINTDEGDVTIQNSIVAGNMAGNSGPDLSPPYGTLTINHSLIGVADGLTITGNVGNQTGTAASPLNPLLGPLADNGGLTLPDGAVIQTHALLPGSTAIDAGDDNVIETVDQRGFARNVSGVDIGAYEAQIVPSADFDTDGDVDGFDFLLWQRGFGTSNAQRTDGNSDDDTDTDASDLAAWQVSFGQPQPPILSAVQSEPEAVSSGQPAVASAELIDPALIDAAMALEWLGSDSDKETRFVAEQTTLEAVFASADELEELAPTGSIASNIDAALASSDNIESTVESTAERWLADELLERVFA